MRSIDAAWEVHRTGCEGSQRGTKGAPRNWKRTAVRWHWVQRAAAWDQHVDQVYRVEVAVKQAAARDRELHLAQGALSALSAPIWSLLEALHDPTVLPRLVQFIRSGPDALLAVVALVAQVSRPMAELIRVERIILGLAPARGVVEPEPVRSNALPMDAEAERLALRLLERLTETSSVANS